MFNGAILNPQCKRERVLCIFILLKTLKRHQFVSPSIISYFRNLKAFFQVKNSTLLKCSPESNQADFQQSLPVLDSALLMTNLAKTHNNLSVIRLKVYCQMKVCKSLQKTGGFFLYYLNTDTCMHTTGFWVKSSGTNSKNPIEKHVRLFPDFWKNMQNNES